LQFHILTHGSRKKKNEKQQNDGFARSRLAVEDPWGGGGGATWGRWVIVIKDEMGDEDIQKHAGLRKNK